jgi:hypothetical protein
VKVRLTSSGSQFDAQNESAFRRDVEQAFNDAASAASVNVLKRFVKADLPPATTMLGVLIYVSDEVGGAIPAFSDGLVWRRVTDRAVVS